MNIDGADQTHRFVVRSSYIRRASALRLLLDPLHAAVRSTLMRSGALRPSERLHLE